MRLAGVLISGSASTCLSPDWWNVALILVFWHHFSPLRPHPTVRLHPNKESGKDLMGGRPLASAYFSFDHHSHNHLIGLQAFPRHLLSLLSRRAVTRRRVNIRGTHNASTFEQSPGNSKQGETTMLKGVVWCGKKALARLCLRHFATHEQSS